MIFEQRQARKRNPSAHQKQMRFFTILFIGGALLLFGLAFYFLNRWMNKSFM
jgi:F0F1-type ATP synthase membrane subunit c/vacuolar-type H+-ATPase subunit K